MRELFTSRTKCRSLKRSFGKKGKRRQLSKKKKDLLDEWTQHSKEDHEQHVMEKRIYREDMENEVRELGHDIFTEAAENAERNCGR